MNHIALVHFEIKLSEHFHQNKKKNNKNMQNHNHQNKSLLKSSGCIYITNFIYTIRCEGFFFY